MKNKEVISINRRLKWGYNRLKLTSQTLKLVVPFSLVTLADISIMFFSTFFTGSIGSVAIAAVSLNLFTYVLFLNFFQGTLTSIGILFANKVGARKAPQEIGALFYTGLIVAIGAACIL